MRKRVVARGKETVKLVKISRGRRRDEDVIIVAFGDGHALVWSRYGVELARKRRATNSTIKMCKAAAFASLPVKRQRQVVSLLGARLLRNLRQKTEMMTPPTSSDNEAVDLDTGGGATRKLRRRRRKAPWGTTAPKMLPTPEQVPAIARGALSRRYGQTWRGLSYHWGPGGGSFGEGRRECDLDAADEAGASLTGVFNEGVDDPMFVADSGLGVAGAVDFTANAAAGAVIGTCAGTSAAATAYFCARLHITRSTYLEYVPR